MLRITDPVPPVSCTVQFLHQGDGLHGQDRDETGIIAKATTSEFESAFYNIVISGHPEQHWSQWFDGLKITNTPKAEAILSGPVKDQAMLHGLLTKIRDLGLPLVSVNRLESEPALRRRRESDTGQRSAA